MRPEQGSFNRDSSNFFLIKMNMEEVNFLLNALSFIKGKKKGLNVFILPVPALFYEAEGYKLIIDNENVDNDIFQRIVDVVDNGS